MNENNYRMDWDERKRYAYDRAYELLEGDTDAFVEACNELNAWDGFLGEDECIPMWEIDGFFTKPSELLDAMDDFNPTDEYFYFHNGNLESCDDVYEHYSDIYSVDEVLDKLIDEYNHVRLNENASLNEVLEVLFAEDFGIDYDWSNDYGENDEVPEEDEPEETDDEFMERIDNL